MLSTTMTKVPVANYGWLHESWMLFVLSGNILIQITPAVNQNALFCFCFYFVIIKNPAEQNSVITTDNRMSNLDVI